MARFVKAVREFEGNYSESWVVVEESDELPSWPANAELAVVGRGRAKQDGPQRVSGRARYTADVDLPGMIHAYILRSPAGHGRVTKLDKAAALAVPGVRAVITYDDPVCDGPLKGIMSGEFAYAGQPLAAVAADTIEAARAGADALGLEFDELPHMTTFEEALRREALVGEPVVRGRGDADAAMERADATIEISGSTPGHLQTALEPHGAVVRWTPGEITAWCSTQGIFSAREEISQRFGVPMEDVRVIAEFIGGGFGAKQGAGKEGVIAAELSRRTGVPVRCLNDRHGEQLDGGIRPPSRQTLKLGATNDGKLVAIDIEAQVAQGGGMFQMVTTPALTLYKIDDVSAIAGSLDINSRPANAFRAPGITEGVTMLEQAMDEMAIAIGMDPIEFRRRNFADVDQGSGEPYTSNELLACYDRAAELAGWATRDELAKPQADGMLRGMGVSSQIWWGGGGPPAHCQIRLGGDGVAHVATGIQDIGTGTYVTAQLVAAEELGIPADKVFVTGGDTRPNIYSPVSGGSQTVPSITPAVRSAAGIVKQKLLELAADVFEVAPEDLDLKDGHFRTADQALDKEYMEIASMLGQATIDGSGNRGPNPEGYRTNTFGCQIAQIAVDPGTGQITVEKIIAVHDIGRVINPLGASSQVEGGILQGMAFATMEERVLDPTIGAPTNATLDDYKIPTIADTPEIVVEFVDHSDDLLSHVGAKGLGEPPIVPTAAAIANAFRHATGVRLSELPLTPARVLGALYPEEVAVQREGGVA
jgi:xanthine dehydrogenase YagR molybdenum-binding subunit